MASDREVVLHRPLRAERVVDDEREDKVSADARLAAAVRVGKRDRRVSLPPVREAESLPALTGLHALGNPQASSSGVTPLVGVKDAYRQASQGG
jgi:hypothetical protein